MRITFFKNKSKTVFILIFIGWLMLQTPLAWAMNNTDIALPAMNTGLPLTPQEIAKLQHLFKPHGDNIEFQTDTPHEHVVWDQTPIDVVLPVGIERRVSFPTPVQFGYDKTLLTDNLLQIQNNNGVLYLKAKVTFAPQRVEVKCTDSGKIILLNLSARQGASHTPLDVVMSQGAKPSLLRDTPVERETNTDDNAFDNQSSSLTAVTLTRFAAQQLYAPKRLLTQPPPIYRVPMRTNKTISLLLDGSVIAMPLASWRGGDLFVTAVLLRNVLSQALTLDSRNLCGAWQASSFFPLTQLSGRGNREDTTTVFLISKRPFAESLKDCGI